MSKRNSLVVKVFFIPELSCLLTFFYEKNGGRALDSEYYSQDSIQLQQTNKQTNKATFYKGIYFVVMFYCDK